MTKRNRFTPEVRREQILDAALKQAKEHGYSRLTRDQIAAAAGCSTGLISLCFGTMPDLRRDIVRAALRTSCLVVIGQALAARNPHVKNVSDEVKQQALAAVMTAT